MYLQSGRFGVFFSNICIHFYAGIFCKNYKNSVVYGS